MKLSAMVLVLASCATPYQPMGWSGGYAESPLGPDTWSVRVEVNGHTSAGTAMEYAYRRAGELCGGQRFDVVDGTQQQKDVFLVNGNMVTNHPKTNLSIIVRCRQGGSVSTPSTR